MSDDLLRQSAVNPENTVAAIAALNERTLALGREMRELKDTHREQMAELRAQNKALVEKMDAVLTVMSEARGGWKTLMLIGGAAGSLGAGLAWLAGHLPKLGG